MFPFRIVRLAVLVSVLVFAIIVLGITAHLTARTTEFGFTLNSMSLGLATAIFTFLSLPVLLTVDLLRTGAFTSKIVVELVWLGILWVLWLVTAATSIGGRDFLYPFGCSVLGDPLRRSTCDEISAVMGISFLVWIILLAYFVTLIIFSFIASSRGHKGVWTSTVKEVDFLAAKDGNAIPPVAAEHEKVTTTAPQQYQQQQQQQYTQPQPQFTQHPQYSTHTGTPDSTQYPPSGYPATQSPVSHQTHASPYPQV